MNFCTELSKPEVLPCDYRLGIVKALLGIKKLFKSIDFDLAKHALISLQCK